MSWEETKRKSIWSRRVDHDLARIWSFVRDNPERSVVALGILLRVAMYLNDRSYFMDEASLAENLKNKPILDFSGGFRAINWHQWAS